MCQHTVSVVQGPILDTGTQSSCDMPLAMTQHDCMCISSPLILRASLFPSSLAGCCAVHGSSGQWQDNQHWQPHWLHTSAFEVGRQVMILVVRGGGCRRLRSRMLMATPSTFEPVRVASM